MQEVIIYKVRTVINNNNINKNINININILNKD